MLSPAKVRFADSEGNSPEKMKILEEQMKSPEALAKRTLRTSQSKYSASGFVERDGSVRKSLKYDHKDHVQKLQEAIKRTRYQFVNGMPSYALVDTL